MNEHEFKTLYFPADRTRTGKSARVTISIPKGGTNGSGEFAAFIKSLSSRSLRLAIGNPFLEDIEGSARNDGRSFSSACLRLLKGHFNGLVKAKDGDAQLLLFGAGQTNGPSTERTKTDNAAVSFQESRRHPVHRWYPYVEGFSATYV